LKTLPVWRGFLFSACLEAGFTARYIRPATLQIGNAVNICFGIIVWKNRVRVRTTLEGQNENERERVRIEQDQNKSESDEAGNRFKVSRNR